MKNDNFYTVQGWMVNDLQLSGNELICYAIIYNVSQDGDSLFMGSLNYLKSWMNVSQPTVLKALKTLTEKGLVEKIEGINNGVRYCYYRSTKGTKETLVGGTKESLVGGTKETLVGNKYNIYNNKDNNKEKINKKDAEASPMSEDEQYFYKFLKERCPYVYKMEQPMTYEQYKKACSKYSREKIWKALDAMNNWKELNKKRRYAYKTLLNWLERDNQQYK